MDKIDIYDIETYPKELEQMRINALTILEKSKNILFENADEMYRFLDICYYEKSEPIASIICNIKQFVIKNEIICFHNTRVLDVVQIKNNGLKFPINNYKERIKGNLELSKISKETIKMITSNIDKILNDFSNEPLDLKKHSQISFYLNFNHHNDYQKFYEDFGGEILEQAIRISSIDDDLKNTFLKLGNPVIVKFSIPFSLIESYKQEEILIKILEYWIEKYILKLNKMHDVCEGRILCEVPQEKIIKIVDLHILSDK